MSKTVSITVAVLMVLANIFQPANALTVQRVNVPKPVITYFCAVAHSPVFWLFNSQANVTNFKACFRR